MFRNNSPFANDTNSYAGSIQSSAYSIKDEVSSQASNMSRPSAKSIYLQRKEYVDSVNKMLDKFQYKVEHLFNCDLDGRELRNVGDCVERLKLLHGMGRVWGQNMLLHLRGSNLLLTDTDTKDELESMAISDVLELKAVLDAGVYNSLLTLSVRLRNKKTTTVFMFQCDEVRADYVQRDLSLALVRRKDDPNFSSATLLVALDETENHPKPATISEEERPEEQRLEEQRPVAQPVPLWTAPSDDEEDHIQEPELVVLHDKEEEEEPPPLQPFKALKEPSSAPRQYTELNRNLDILNHILSDVEILMGKVAAAAAKNAKKKKLFKKSKAIDGMPTREEFATCLHKIKCGFNLLGDLNGKMDNPSAPNIVHSLFSTLALIIPHCPVDMPPTIVAPLLTPLCIRLMSAEASAEEDRLWQTLGDAWNIPSTQWPEDDEDIPTYTLEFSDGWEPPEVTAESAINENIYSTVIEDRKTPQHHPPQHHPPQHHPPQHLPPQHLPPQHLPPQHLPPQHRPLPSHSDVSKPCPMRVKYDFISRNHRELTIRQGEIVELLDMSKQWWRVRNSRGEEGYVPNNVLEDIHDEKSNEQTGVCAVLTKKSKPAEVRAWLEEKEFSKITVRCLGVLSGTMLLGMSREELKMVCPEEGGRVFLQLQAVKSTLAAAN